MFIIPYKDHGGSLGCLSASWKCDFVSNVTINHSVSACKCCKWNHRHRMVCGETSECVLFQVSCHQWGVLSIKEPGSWEEHQWAYQTVAGWSAYREGTVMHLLFCTFSSNPEEKPTVILLRPLTQISLEFITSFYSFLFCSLSSVIEATLSAFMVFSSTAAALIA